MSIPFNSTGPTPPSGSSNPVSFKQWFIAIIDWIKGLSPAGATVYDTGWINLTLLNGWLGTDSPAVRRVGNTAFLRGEVYAGTLGATVAQLPSGLFPTTRVSREVRRWGASTGNVGKLDIDKAGVMVIRESNGAASSPGLCLTDVSWLVS